MENAQALLELVQANYGVDTTSLSELLLNSGSSVESFLSGLAPQLSLIHISFPHRIHLVSGILAAELILCIQNFDVVFHTANMQ